MVFIKYHQMDFPSLSLFFTLCSGLDGEKYPISSSHDAKARLSEVTVISHSKLMSPSSVENSDSGMQCFEF